MGSRNRILVMLATFALCLLVATPVAMANGLSPMEELGKALLFDAALSAPPGQSCAVCHAPEVGYTGPDSVINAGPAIYPGAVMTRYGNRKPPTAAYGGDSPVLYYDADDEVWVGGMFWDGRATGWTLGDPLAEQAMGPFLNPLEQNNPMKRIVVFKVAMGPYADLYEAVWAEPADFKKEVDLAYERIARSIAAYERSSEVNPFSSKFDTFWATVGDPDAVEGIDSTNWMPYSGMGLTDEELEGFALFNDETKGRCSLCHTLDTGTAEYPLFTDFTYDNLGLPRNPENPFYDATRQYNPEGYNWIDPGLGGFLKGAGNSVDDYEAEWGKHKVPTLRNVDKRPSAGFVKAFGHNGYFKSLEEITHFYNTRDVGSSWPAPEYAATMNTDELGNLGLSAAEEAKIVAFMRTLSDQ